MSERVGNGSPRRCASRFKEGAGRRLDPVVPKEPPAAPTAGRNLDSSRLAESAATRLPPKKYPAPADAPECIADRERGKGQSVLENVQQFLQWSSPAQGLALGTRLGLPLLQFERLRGAPSRGPVCAAAALSQVRGLNHFDLYQT